MKKFRIMVAHPYIVRKAGTVDGRGVIARKDVWLFHAYHRDTLRKLISFIHPYLRHDDRKKQVEKVLQSLAKLKV